MLPSRTTTAIRKRHQQLLQLRVGAGHPDPLLQRFL